MFIDSLLCTTVLVIDDKTESVIEQLKYNMKIAKGSFEVKNEEEVIVKPRTQGVDRAGVSMEVSGQPQDISDEAESQEAEEMQGPKTRSWEKFLGLTSNLSEVQADLSPTIKVLTPIPLSPSAVSQGKEWDRSEGGERVPQPQQGIFFKDRPVLWEHLSAYMQLSNSDKC